jgi:hypothetical protein
LAGLIKTDTCNLLSLKYSTSVISSITTTLPSAGQIICPLFSVCWRAGILKKETINSTNAGAVAKRIVNYLEVGQKVEQCQEMGFIKFGSRVDLLLPVGTKLNVELNEVVKGGVTVIATL